MRGLCGFWKALSRRRLALHHCVPDSRRDEPPRYKELVEFETTVHCHPSQVTRESDARPQNRSISWGNSWLGGLEQVVGRAHPRSLACAERVPSFRTGTKLAHAAGELSHARWCLSLTTATTATQYLCRMHFSLMWTPGSTGAQNIRSDLESSHSQYNHDARVLAENLRHAQPGVASATELEEEAGPAGPRLD